jgi:hypothetical protein
VTASGSLTTDARPTIDRGAAVRAVLAGIVLSALAWVDPLFLPLVLLGPIVTGVVWAIRRQSWRGPALSWAIAGAGMLVSDWIVNQEDQGFHAVLTLVMVGLLRLAHLVVSAVVRRTSR